MKVRLFCESCDGAIDRREPFAPGPARCEVCGTEHPFDPDAELLAGRPPARCAGCGHDHFHLRKRFPRRIGLVVVLAAAILTFSPLVPPQLFFLPLIIASLIDLGLYFVLPWKQVCYVCEAEYSGGVREGLGPFDLETATECARLRKKKRPTRA